MITTAGSDEKLDRARADGADEVINYRTENVTDRALELTDGHGVDLVIEHLGGEQFGAALGALRRGGRLVTCGGHAGEVVDLDIIPVFRNEWTVAGSRTGMTKETQLVMDLIAEGTLHPRVHAVLPVDEAAEGHRIIEEREQFGKVVLNP